MTIRLSMPACLPLSLIGLLTVTAGCGSSDRVAVYPVRGQIVFDGRPMKGGGAIAFIPARGRKGKGAGGLIDPNGFYELSTYGDGDGSMTGDFQVIISQSVYDEPENNGDSDSRQTVYEPKETVPEPDRIPLVYADPQRTSLQATVEPKSLNKIDFALDRK